jgi:C4-type Zn-finger protein
MDCQTRATALSDTECPHCMRKFNTKAALRHIPICEKLTSKE